MATEDTRSVPTLRPARQGEAVPELRATVAALGAMRNAMADMARTIESQQTQINALRRQVGSQ